MGDLTENFSKEEFRCPCCGIADVEMGLVTQLQVLRNQLSLPIKILSGFRCAKHNQAIGSKPTSQHVQGKAADITVGGMHGIDLAARARVVLAFRVGGIGLYSKNENMVHVDVRAGGTSRWIH